MSKSLTELLKNTNNKDSKTLEKKKEDNLSFASESIKSKNKVKPVDEATYAPTINSIKTYGVPRNGVFSFPRQPIFHDKRRENFTYDDAMDGNVAMAQINPDAAPPVFSSNARYSLMPSSVRDPRDQVGLIRKSLETQATRRDRFGKLKQP